MAEMNTIKTVDFIPQKTILGDIKKISEFDIASQNSKITPVLTLICMEEGANQMFPYMGVRKALVSIPYREIKEVYGVLENISSHIARYTGFTTRIYIDEEDPKTNFDRGELAICIEVEGLPRPITVELSRDSRRTFKIRRPSVFIGK
jgi:hypothetical protein